MSSLIKNTINAKNNDKLQTQRHTPPGLSVPFDSVLVSLHMQCLDVQNGGVAVVDERVISHLNSKFMALNARHARCTMMDPWFFSSNFIFFSRSTLTMAGLSTGPPLPL